MRLLVACSAFFGLGLIVGCCLAIYMLTRNLDRRELDAEAAQRYIDRHGKSKP